MNLWRVIAEDGTFKQSSYTQCKMSLSEMYSRSKLFGSKTFFCFQSRLPLRFVGDDDEAHMPTNQLRFAGFRKPLPSLIHKTNPDASTCTSVCLSSRQKLVITEWERSNSQFLLYNALGSDSRRSLSDILVYVQKTPSSEMYKIHVANKLLVYPPFLHRFREFAEKERES